MICAYCRGFGIGDACPSCGSEQLRVPPEKLGELVRIVQHLVRTNQQMAAAGIVVGLAGGPDARRRFVRLCEIDRACQARGRITPEEAIEREGLVLEAVAELGYDPRVAAPPQEPASKPRLTIVRPQLTRELEEGPETAQGFGGLWMQKGTGDA